MALQFTEFATINPARSYLFQAIVDGISPLLVRGGNFPFNAFESFSHLDENSVSYFVGPGDVADVDITIYENEERSAWKFFIDWRNLIINENGTYNLPSKYKKKIELELLGTKRTSNMKLIYNGAWPKRISNVIPDWANREPMTFIVTFSVDGVITEIPEFVTVV